VQCLVKELEADVNQATNDGTTPLCIAALEGHIAVVQCLVKELGADINQAALNGITPLMAASCSHQGASGTKHTEIVVWLSKHGADAQASPNDHGRHGGGFLERFWWTS
jgi:hypoxanthine-guanine phosphoribosyltransferase